jgi:hypothetical protein
VGASPAAASYQRLSGALTALLYPERAFVVVPAARAYYTH